MSSFSLREKVRMRVPWSPESTRRAGMTSRADTVTLTSILSFRERKRPA
jgi:hypothetical protein